MLQSTMDVLALSGLTQPKVGDTNACSQGFKAKGSGGGEGYSRARTSFPMVSVSSHSPPRSHHHLGSSQLCIAYFKGKKSSQRSPIFILKVKKISERETALILGLKCLLIEHVWFPCSSRAAHSTTHHLPGS